MENKLNGTRSALETLASEVEHKANQMQSETLEPIVFYMQEYQNEASSTFSQAEKLYKSYEEL